MCKMTNGRDTAVNPDFNRGGNVPPLQVSGVIWIMLTPAAVAAAVLKRSDEGMIWQT